MQKFFDMTGLDLDFGLHLWINWQVTDILVSFKAYCQAKSPENEEDPNFFEYGKHVQ